MALSQGMRYHKEIKWNYSRRVKFVCVWWWEGVNVQENREMIKYFLKSQKKAYY